MNNTEYIISKARTTVVTARKKGLLKTRPCELCGNDYKIQAHHEDYKKPLDIIWLCASCHKKLHIEKKLELTHKYGKQLKLRLKIEPTNYDKKRKIENKVLRRLDEKFKSMLDNVSD